MSCDALGLPRGSAWGSGAADGYSSPSTLMLTRAEALIQLEALAKDAHHKIILDSGLTVADLALIVRRQGQGDENDDELAVGDDEDEATAVSHSGARSIKSRRKLAQIWAVLAAVHATLVANCKMTQRELWYRLKPSGLFSGPPIVNERILDLAAAVTARAGVPCPREALGIIAAPRGSMTGCLTILTEHEGGAPQHLDHSVFQIPGDTEAIRALRFDPTPRAECVLVVEKDSIFRRLVDDRFTERKLPCVVVTGCGFPDLATRALVQRVVEFLQVPCYCLTDYNPHGMALMLTYKYGTSKLGLERHCSCPTLRWLGLRAAHVRRASDGVGYGDAWNHEDDRELEDEETHRTRRSANLRPLPADCFQAFSSRDRAVLAGLERRLVVQRSPGLSQEIQQMHATEVKVEIESLYCHGFDYLSTFIHERILCHEYEYGMDNLSTGGAVHSDDPPARSPDEDYHDRRDAASDSDDVSQDTREQHGGAHSSLSFEFEEDDDDAWLQNGPDDDWWL